MITNTGKTIIGKYLLGQAPAYASHIAVGCGATPLSDTPTTEQKAEYAEKTNLDFEMFRVAISSRGFVNEDGVAKIVLTAELPTEERYEFTEVGLYSAGLNPAASSNDSRTIFGFTQGEAWKQHSEAGAITSIPVIAERLDNNDVIEDPLVPNPTNPNETISATIFQANADNATFANAVRSGAYERGRFYNNMLLMRGDSSIISSNNGYSVLAGDHVHLTGIRTDFSKNSPIDELRLAFSLINKEPSQDEPTAVRLLVEFASEDSSSENTEYARFWVDLSSNDLDINFINNRYFVVNKQLQQLEVSQNFAWASVTAVRIYASVINKYDFFSIAGDGTTTTIVSNTNTNLEVGEKFVFYSNTNTALDVCNGVQIVTEIGTIGDNYTVSFESTLDTDEQYVQYTESLPYIERPSKEYHVSLDAMRFENIGTVSPLYGLTGYSVVSNINSAPILKNPNTNNYLEFRFALGVQ